MIKGRKSIREKKNNKGQENSNNNKKGVSEKRIQLAVVQILETWGEQR